MKTKIQIHIHVEDQLNATLCGLAIKGIAVLSVNSAAIHSWPTDVTGSDVYQYCEKCLSDPRIPLLKLRGVEL